MKKYIEFCFFNSFIKNFSHHYFDVGKRKVSVRAKSWVLSVKNRLMAHVLQEKSPDLEKNSPGKLLVFNKKKS